MTTFVARIELHRAERKDYAALHKMMTEKGFRQTAPSDIEPIDEMLLAEFHFQGDLTRADVIELASAAAAAVKPNYNVRVSNMTGLTWFMHSAIA